MSLIKTNLQLLEQGSRLLECIGDVDYAAGPDAAPGTGIGAQFRHIIDHYLSFLDGWPKGVVDYQHRQRDPRIEACPSAAIAAHQELATRLMQIPATAAPLLVRLESSGHPSNWGPSSVSRELDFLLSHTVHHHALIALMCSKLGIQPEANFGVAPATQRYLQSREPSVPSPGATMTT